MAAAQGSAGAQLVLWLALIATTANAQERSASRAFADDWSEGKQRGFAALSVLGGAISRTDMAIGYGKPHWTWLGIEASAAASADMAMTQLRARLALVYVDLAVGWSRVWSFRRTALPATSSYRRLRQPDRDELRYHALSLALSGLFPGPHGYFDWQLEALRVAGGVDLGAEAIYEEGLRVVMAPPWAALARLGYGYTFSQKRGMVGLLAEAVWPGDRDAVIVRVGPSASWTFSPRLDLALALTTPVYGPDQLAIYPAIWGNLRARYRTASR